MKHSLIGFFSPSLPLSLSFTSRELSHLSSVWVYEYMCACCIILPMLVHTEFTFLFSLSYFFPFFGTQKHTTIKADSNVLHFFAMYISNGWCSLCTCVYSVWLFESTRISWACLSSYVFSASFIIYLFGFVWCTLLFYAIRLFLVGFFICFIKSCNRTVLAVKIVITRRAFLHLYMLYKNISNICLYLNKYLVWTIWATLFTKTLVRWLYNNYFTICTYSIILFGYNYFVILFFQIEIALE